MKTQTIKYYLFSTIAISWSFWLLAAALTHLGKTPFSNPLVMLLFILGGISPAFNEIYLKKKTSTLEEYRTFKKNIIHFKQPLKAYLLVFGIAWLFCFLPVLLGGSVQLVPLYVAILEFPIMIIGGGIEEIGWRGFLQPMLQKKFSTLASACIVSLIWTFWHIPLWWIQGSNQSSMSLIWFTLTCFSLSILLSYIWNKYESIYLCIIFHAAINSFWDVYVSNNKLLPTAIILILCVGFFLLTNRRAPEKNHPLTNYPQ
ncbi:CPBP family intramembrane glutamic endopeptidase [Candidatus Enterococcus murrayae]|uniref:CPBP family intramembrane metalloprotease n=1 Tax=Candidatus Enterococcus murrayae TaxID=2815321 RepID=A0ABS3HFL9_9ENTE|nr:CPBP family intramembrane glutamic endopeptidase [Enterococcus sp. MJM16]MBO0452255.1 CPBP family intramembrane metalloprotease [Enterococcus sp. MJM16]